MGLYKVMRIFKYDCFLLLNMKGKIINGIFKYVGIKGHYSEEFNIQYYICPNCLEIIEGDMCFKCGRLFVVDEHQVSDSATLMNPEVIKAQH